MKRFVAAILVLFCIFSFAGCAPDHSADNPGSVNNSSGSSTSQGGTSSNTPQDGIVPDGDNVVNEDGNLNIPMPEEGTFCVVSSDLWDTLLSEDAITAAMKDNSITTLTSSNNAEEYQMYFCSGSRYGSILNGNYRSETIYATEDGTAYIYSKDSNNTSWVRTTSSQSYDEYVTLHYTNGAMQFLSGLAAIYDKAEYVKAEEAYVIENHVVAISGDETLTGTLKIQFTNEKLYSISLTMTVEGQIATLRTMFGTVATPSLPTDFTEGNSGSVNVSPEYSTDNQGEPKESVCSEQRWQRLFGQRLIDNMMDHQLTIQIQNGQQEYLFQMNSYFSRFVISGNGNYEEIIINRHERFQRDSKDGQWLHYTNSREQEAFINDKTAVLSQLLTPLEDRYNQASFNGASRCFSLKDVTFDHGTFGTLTGDYAITIQGGMLKQIKATFQASGDTWTLMLEESKDNGIEAPTDFIEADKGKPGKN